MTPFSQTFKNIQYYFERNERSRSDMKRCCNGQFKTIVEDSQDFEYHHNKFQSKLIKIKIGFNY